MTTIGNARMTRPTVRVQATPQFNPAGRRFIRSAAVVAVLSASLFGFVAQANAGAESGSQVQFKYVTVSAGQTLWEIAQQYATSDARDYMANLISLNALTTAELTPGQRIALPN